MLPCVLLSDLVVSSELEGEIRLFPFTDLDGTRHMVLEERTGISCGTACAIEALTCNSDFTVGNRHTEELLYLRWGHSQLSITETVSTDRQYYIRPGRKG